MPKNGDIDSGRINLNESQNNSDNQESHSDNQLTGDTEEKSFDQLEPDKQQAQQEELQNQPAEEPKTVYEMSEIPPKVLAITAIVSGILIMVGGFIAYRYFSTADVNNVDDSIPMAEVQVESSESDGIDSESESDQGQITSGVSTSRAEDDWQTPGDSFGITQTSSPNLSAARTDPQGAGENTVAQRNISPKPTEDTATITQGNTKQSGQWVANDYEFGDINSGSYTVVSGDTLWEIAEAVYGNGADWHKIMDANSDDIGYLANGNPLIIPGQVLNIPF